MLDRVLVIAGGLSAEREVSLRSGQRVAEALQGTGVDVEVRDIDAGLIPALAADPSTVVFPVLHGTTGEDGTLQEILRLSGVPYVGSPPESCRAAFDKPVAKQVLRRAGLATPASVTLPRTAFHDLGAGALSELVLRRVGLPLYVKPRAGGSAFGITLVTKADQLPQAMMACFGYHDTALIEAAVEGPEITVAVLDLDGTPVALPPVEIVPDSGVYDYAARYTAGATEFFCPARLPAAVVTAATEAALHAHRALGLRDLSRTDMIVDADGVIQILETNVAPGMTSTSTWPMALEFSGRDFGETCRALSLQAMKAATTREAQ